MTNRLAGCVNPREISPDDLIAHAQGDAPPAAIRHIERCPTCQEQAAQYARAHAALSAELFRHSCPSTLTIGEYVLGVLPPDAARTVAEHLIDCPHCAAERRETAAFLKEDDEPEGAHGFVDTVRRLLARPLAPTAPALAGLRGAEDCESGVYLAEGLRVTISVQRTRAGARGGVLVGLVEPWTMASDGGRAHLYANDRIVQTQEVDDLGNFVFDAVPAGSYRIEVKLSDVVVTIDAVTVS
jgi:anti-sigma factor RsiW